MLNLELFGSGTVEIIGEGITLEYRNPVFTPLSGLERSYSFPFRVANNPDTKRFFNYLHEEGGEASENVRGTLTWNGMPIEQLVSLQNLESNNEFYEVALNAEGVPWLERNANSESSIQDRLINTSWEGVLTAYQHPHPISPRILNESGADIDDRYPLMNWQEWLILTFKNRVGEIDFVSEVEDFGRMYQAVNRNWNDGSSTPQFLYFPGGLSYKDVFESLCTIFGAYLDFDRVGQRVVFKHVRDYLKDSNYMSAELLKEGFTRNYTEERAYNFEFSGVDGAIPNSITEEAQAILRNNLRSQIWERVNTVSRTDLPTVDRSSKIIPLPSGGVWNGNLKGEAEDFFANITYRDANDVPRDFTDNYLLRWESLTNRFYQEFLQLVQKQHSESVRFYIYPSQAAQVAKCPKIMFDTGRLFVPEVIKVNVPSGRAKRFLCEADGYFI